MKRSRHLRDAKQSEPRSGSFPELPVRDRKDELLAAISGNDVVIVVAETASGKTTQIPQMILENDPAVSVVCTQPRRVAAISVANRVASERGTVVGDEIGYTVRFDDKSTPGVTRIRYATDGILAREAISTGISSLRRRYSHIIIDEVHERSVNTDILLGVVKMLLQTNAYKPQRKPNSGIMGKLIRSSLSFKIIIMSATTDVRKIMNFFREVPQTEVSLLEIKGESHDVSLLHASYPVSNYLEASIQTLTQEIAERADSRDILVFLPGKEDIRDAIITFKREVPRDKHKKFIVFPLHSELLPEDQLKAIRPLPAEYRATRRKIIFSTNIAETSVTIPDVDAVVDCGLAKVRDMRGKTSVAGNILSSQPISKAQAQQRMGRTGRTGPGRVYRLYTEDEYSKMDAFPKPEILRTDACNTLLQIVAIIDLFRKKTPRLKDSSGNATSTSGHQQEINVHTFPLLDPVPRELLEIGLETLVVLGAVDSSMNLTQIGRLMCRFPVPPMLARSLLESVRVGCVDAMLSVAAVLSTDGMIFINAPVKREKVTAAQKRFRNVDGDHLTMANVFHAYMLTKVSKRSEFCKDHFLNSRTLSTAMSIRNQLDNVARHGDIMAWALQNPLSAEISSEIVDSGMDELVRRCLVAGYFRNVAQKREDTNEYGTLEHSSEKRKPITAHIHPGSSILSFRRKRLPELVLYNELLVTTKTYMSTVVRIEQRWLTQHSTYFKG